MERLVNGACNFSGNQSPVIIFQKLEEILCMEVKKMAIIMVTNISKHSGNKMYLPSRYKKNRKELYVLQYILTTLNLHLLRNI